MSKYPYMTLRKGSRNWWYKRTVPKALIADGRPKQIWRSLQTSDAPKAKIAYRSIDSEIDQLFANWRMVEGAQHSAGLAPLTPTEARIRPLSPALLRNLGEQYRVEVYEDDFRQRGAQWGQVQADHQSFYRGEIVNLPSDNWLEFNNAFYDPYVKATVFASVEDHFLYCSRLVRKSRIAHLERSLQLGDSSHTGEAATRLLAQSCLSLNSTDLQRLQRALLAIEVATLTDIADGMQSFGLSMSPEEADQKPAIATSSVAAMSELTDIYIQEASRLLDWPLKTTKRKRAELRDFIELAGDKPINTYTHKDGERFKTVQLRLPANRQQHPFRGERLSSCAELADGLQRAGEQVMLLSALTINDKIGTVSLFFNWARLRDRDAGISDPVKDLAIPRRRGKHKKKMRYPWSVAELNRMFASPIFTGCRSLSRWSQSGDLIANRSAIYWIPLIALFSGLRLGEIVQLRVTDVKRIDDIEYFDVRTVIDDDEFDGTDLDETEIKSLKNNNGRRGIPIHTDLHRLGFAQFVAFRRAEGSERLFPEFNRAEDDESWSKQFSKHFTRFRRSIGVTRKGVTFQSLRHNVEDKLRNADVRKDVRDAVQGHGETGVSREYGTGYYLKTLDKAIQQIRYEGLQLPVGAESTS